MIRVSDDPVQLVALARAIATEAAAMVDQARRAGPVTATTKATPTDMVTEYDRRSEALIAERIHAARPDDAIFGEEGADTRGTSGIEWLVDPIDGTTNYLYGLPGYNVSIAARDGDGGLVGVVAVPTIGELYHAHRGGGAFCNDRPIRCSATTDLALALVSTGFSYDGERRTEQAERLARFIAQIRDIRRFGAAATDLCFTASGRLDAYFEEHLGPWDFAAGEVIAREAGCRMSSLDGGPVRPDSVLVAAPGVFDALLAAVTAASSPTT